MTDLYDEGGILDSLNPVASKKLREHHQRTAELEAKLVQPVQDDIGPTADPLRESSATEVAEG